MVCVHGFLRFLMVRIVPHVVEIWKSALILSLRGWVLIDILGSLRKLNDRSLWVAVVGEALAGSYLDTSGSG